MVLAAAELAAQLRQTAAFIAADPVDLSVSRYAVTRVPGGGVRPTGAPTITTRRARMIPVGGVTAPPASSGAPVRHGGWTLMAMPGDDWATGDTFTFEGMDCRVAAVTVGSYETKATVEAVSG